MKWWKYKKYKHNRLVFGNLIWIMVFTWVILYGQASAGQLSAGNTIRMAFCNVLNLLWLICLFGLIYKDRREIE